jgi:hypothetical protein
VPLEISVGQPPKISAVPDPLDLVIVQFIIGLFVFVSLAFPRKTCQNTQDPEGKSNVLEGQMCFIFNKLISTPTHRPFLLIKTFVKQGEKGILRLAAAWWHSLSDALPVYQASRPERHF